MQQNLVRLWRIPDKLSGHAFFYGRIGCQPSGSLVLMADGSWKEIQNIKVGDEIISPQEDGTNTFEKVTSTTSWFSDENYKVSQLNRGKKELYKCSFNHQIPVKNHINVRETIDGKRKYVGMEWRYKNFQASYLASMSKKKRATQNLGFSSFLIDNFKGKKNPTIDAYALGVHLGDGCFRGTNMLSINTMDREVIDAIPYKFLSTSGKKDSKASDYRYSSKSPFPIELRKLGLHNKLSGDKFIPEECFFSDSSYRKGLLAGLIDTDGYYSNGGYEITLKSKKLVEGIRYLVYSLGGKCGDIRKKIGRIKSRNFEGIYWRMSFYLGDLHLPLQVKRRKRDMPLSYLSSNRIQIDLQKDKPLMVYGFSITGNSKWYVTDNWMVTHNSGKTQKMTTIAQGFYEKNYKIWDVFGGKRSEGLFWTLPNKDFKLWNAFENETYELTSPGAKEYPVNIIYPMFSKYLPKKLPGDHTITRVKSKVFTIPIQDIIQDDIQLAIGESAITSNAIYTWETIQKKVNKNSAGNDIDYIIDKHLEGSKNQNLSRLFIRTLVDNHLLAPKNCDLNLDIIEEAKQKDTITVLCLDYVPERFKLFIMGYMIRKITEFLEKDKIHKKNIGMFRETSMFMKVQDSMDKKGDSTQAFRNLINNCARYGRDGFYLFMDTQSPREVSSLIEGSDDLLCICELPSPSDREVICTPLIRDKRMTRSQMSALSMLKIEQICIIPRGERAKILKRIAPPRTRYWEEGKGNFYTIWRKEKDLWRSTSDDIDLIKNIYKERESSIRIRKAEDSSEDNPLPKEEKREIVKEIEKQIEDSKKENEENSFIKW